MTWFQQFHPSICLCICLPNADIMSKQMDISSLFWHSGMAFILLFWVPHSLENSNGNPLSRGVKYMGEFAFFTKIATYLGNVTVLCAPWRLCHSSRCMICSCQGSRSYLLLTSLISDPAARISDLSSQVLVTVTFRLSGFMTKPILLASSSKVDVFSCMLVQESLWLP